MIFRARRRARRESVSFRTLGWLVVRVAAWNLLHGTWPPERRFSEAWHLAQLKTEHLRLVVRRRLRIYGPGGET